ncbi:MAG TPA: cation:proton antiporter, partial [Kofleriaceae bacterium]|nr:cation:proton antiporter [Kofleriaceae bacterium]
MDWLLPNPVTRFLAQAIAIIVASRLVGVVMRRIGQPMVIAEIVAGILLGPSLLGWLAPDAKELLFPASSLGLLQIVSQIGLILFMFLVGLELDPRLLRGRTHTSVLISHTSIVVPFLLGVGLASWLYPRFADQGVRFSAFALFMGAAMSITAFPVLARILTERRLLRTRVGALTIACAAVDDVTAWCILAFVVAISRSTALHGAFTTTALAAAYVLVMLVAVRPLLVRLAARVATPEAMTQNLVAVVLVLVFLSSWATELIGIHALFGAFIFGAVLPKQGGFARALAEKLEDLVLVVLLPLFFAFSGLRTDISLLSSSYHWLVCALIIAVACAGKFGGAAIPARLTGLSWRESATLGLLMNTRGLMELIVINIGLDLGVISPTIFSMMVVMALFTTFLTTPAVAAIYPADVMARDLLEVEPAPPEPAPPARRELDVLVCVADDRSGPGLVALAGALTRGGGAIHALHLAAADRGSDRMEGTAEAGPLQPLLDRAAELALARRFLAAGAEVT